MTVAYKIIRETFTSRVTLDRPNRRIFVEYLSGPFKRMHNRWTFHPAGDRACDVEFFITYEFKSRALAMLMGAMFDAAFRRFAVAFERSEDVVEGRKTEGRGWPGGGHPPGHQNCRRSGARAHSHHEVVESEFGNLQPCEGVGTERYEAVIEFLEMRIVL